jgi:hypothetical protein
MLRSRIGAQWGENDTSASGLTSKNTVNRGFTPWLLEQRFSFMIDFHTSGGILSDTRFPSPQAVYEATIELANKGGHVRRSTKLLDQ